MQNLIERDELIDYLTKKYKQAQVEFDINMACLKGEQDFINKIKTFSDFLESSKKISDYHERFGYNLGQVELVLDLLKKFNNEQD